MLGAFLHTQPIHQTAFSKVTSFDGHLHSWSPLHSTAHRKNRTITDLSLAGKALQPLCWVRDSLVPLILTPIGQFVYCHYVNEEYIYFKKTLCSVIV